MRVRASTPGAAHSTEAGVSRAVVIAIAACGVAAAVHGQTPERPTQAPMIATDVMTVIADGFLFPEGPEIGPNGDLYFTDSQGSRIYRWGGDAVHLFASETEHSNGLTLDRAGNVYACAGRGHKLLRFSSDGRKSVLVASVAGKPLNNPNDIVMDGDGNLYFTNPRGRAPSIVFAEPDGGARVVADDPAAPNGIALSPDERTLYVGDYRGDCIWAYTLASAGNPRRPRRLAEFPDGGPDGVAVAESGNLYVVLHRAGKIVVLRPNGDRLQEFAFPEGTGPTNLCFGGPGLKTLYVTVAGRAVPQLRAAFADSQGSYEAQVRDLAGKGLVGKVYAVPVAEAGVTPPALRSR